MRLFKIISFQILTVSLCLFCLVVSANSQTDKTVRFTIIGDRTGGAIEGIYEKVILQAERLKPDFMITVGDMIEGYTGDTAQLNKEYKEILAMYEPVKIPLFFTPGNHDITFDEMEPYYKRYFGQPYYSTDFESIHLVILDNSRCEQSADLPSEQLDWLEADLKANQKASMRLVFMHKPFWYNSLAMGRSDTLHTLFKKYNVKAVFCGHFHSYFTGEYDGIKYTTIGSSGAEYGDGPGELGHHFAYVTASGSDLSIAPIKADAVLSWNVRSVNDVILGTQNKYMGLQFLNGAVVGSDMTIKNAKVAMRIANYSPDKKIDDTLKWTIPEGWTVEPAMMPVSLLPHLDKNVEFTISSTGPLFPLPEVSMNFPFSENTPQTVTKALSVNRVAVCSIKDKKPAIDGTLSEGEWTTPQKDFFAADGNPNECDPTEFYFSYDYHNLYLAAKCYEKNMDSLFDNTTEQDGPVYSEDCVGYFLKPNPERDSLYQLYFNPMGIVFDQAIWQEKDGYYRSDKAWNSDCKVATVEGEGFWSVEVEIPLKQFGLTGQTGNEWRINFRRKQKRLEKTANWQAPIDYNPETFGLLKFK